MLCRPAVFRSPAIVIGPDNLIQEVLTAKDFVEKNLAVVNLSIVDVKVKGTSWAKESVRFTQAGLKESQVIVEAVEKRGCFAFGCLISLTLETSTVSIGVLGSVEPSPSLQLPRVEWWVYVDEVNRFGLPCLQYWEVVAKIDIVQWLALREG